ncbi:MAG: hypothetical protein GX119_08955 [Syntrophomonadaceae bacterium]|jgi:predicted methyltransferase|nr:hypothetical protein [Syntrophomonadaceae bacterium]
MLDITKNSLAMVKHILHKNIKAGDTVVDATCGRGQDTLFLAGQVGINGRVYAMDTQAAAIDSTYSLLKNQGLMDNVILIKDNHVNLGDHLNGISPQAAVFNLGYLPGGNKKIITQPDTTIAALNQSIMVLAAGGWVTVVFYTGHEGGREEYEAVSRYLAGLPQSLVTVMEWKYTNQLNHPPGILLIHKVGEI